MPTVSAIIPTYNRADLVRSVLTNLRAQTLQPDQILIVDNGSADATQIVAREMGADLVVFPENRGFAAAVNAGIQQAHGDWLLILNNDVALEPSWLSRVLAAAQQDDALFATGKILQKNDRATIDGSWDLVSRAAYAWRCGYGHRDGAVWSVRRRIAFAPMTAALFSREIFRRIGLLDTRFESYYEDVDFGVRCLLAGIEGVYEPAAVSVHLGKATLGRKARRVYFLSARNQIFLLAKHYPPETLRRFAWPILVGQFLSVMAAANHGQLFTALRGKWKGLRAWAAFRQEARTNARAIIEPALRRSENEIHTLQQQIGYDIYWRLYFTLVRP